MWGPVTHKPWMVKYPTAAKNAAAGNVSVAGAARTLAGFEEGLYSPALAWRDWADEAAAVDWFLLTELTKVRGGGGWRRRGRARRDRCRPFSPPRQVAKHSYHSASFWHIPEAAGDKRVGKLVMGPIWGRGGEEERSERLGARRARRALPTNSVPHPLSSPAQVQGFGTCCGYPVEGYKNGGTSTGASGGGAISPNGWLFPICTREPARCRVLDGYDVGNGIATWWDRLFFNDGAFTRAAAARWRALRAGPWADAAIASTLGAKAAELAAPGARAVARWPEALGKPWLGTPADRAGIVVGDVKQWTLARLAWLDGAWAQAMDETIRAGPYPEAFGKAAAA